ncbi:hypothetical protein ACFS07_33875 [Undibacterium arcticum]
MSTSPFVLAIDLSMRIDPAKCVSNYPFVAERADPRDTVLMYP